MKVYLSGQITGLPIEVARANFKRAEKIIREMGMIPVNPIAEADQSWSWDKLMIRAIMLLLTCEAIFMLDNWMLSKGARIEKSIAEELELRIIFETNIEKTNISNSKVNLIKSVIQEITGLSFEDISTPCRARDKYFARLLFVHHGLKYLSSADIVRILNRSPKTILCDYKQEYIKEFKFNKEFRELAEQVDNCLLKCVSV